jgi:hypothetical protein
MLLLFSEAPMVKLPSSGRIRINIEINDQRAILNFTPDPQG